MGELIIECTLCGGSFGCEKDYDQHPCLEEDVKVPFRIKQEPQESKKKDGRKRRKEEEGGEEEGKTQQQQEEEQQAGEHPSRSAEQLSGERVLRIKDEPSEYMDVEDEDPLRGQVNTDGDGNEVSGEPPELNETVETPEPETKLLKVTDAVSIRNECGVCGKRFYRREDFLNHTTNSHKIPRPFQCKVCKKRFTQKHYVTLHMRVHTGERPYKCKLCSNTYTHKTSFTIHMRIHNGDRPYICGICGKKCYDKSGLTSHMRSHTKETPYECEVCGRRFTHSKSLLVHRRNHTGEKPYKCQYCGKAFRHWHKHKIHLRLHTGERPYKCEICGKGFPRNDEVKRHMRSHQGIKSFKCSICGVYCATQASITGHIELHHADLRQIPLNAPEKTVVKNSNCGILGTKAPQPRTLYKPVTTAASSIQCNISQVSGTQTPATYTSASQNKTVTSKAPGKKHLKQAQKHGDAKKQGKVGEKTKVLSYKEFIELQEKLLLCKGLSVKNANPSAAAATKPNNSKEGTQSKLPNIRIRPPSSITTSQAEGVQDKQQQIVFLSPSNNTNGEGLRLVVPQAMGANKQLIFATSSGTPTQTVPNAVGGQQLVLGQPSLILPQGSLGGGQQLLLLSKPGAQQNSLMLSQPLLLLSGANNQRMVLLPSKAAPGTSGSNLQTILIPSSMSTVSANSSTTTTTTTTAAAAATPTPSVVVKQEPGEPPATPPPPSPPSPPMKNIIPKVVIKEEPGVLPSLTPVIKQEPPDDPPFSSDHFSNIRIKQEPLD